MVKVTYITSDGKETTVEGKEGRSVMETALANDIVGIVGECGGSMACATCHVYVEDEWLDRLPARSVNEEDMLDFTAGERKSNSRLSCQIQLKDELDGIRVTMPESQI